MYKIEKGVPIPDTPHTPVYPWNAMSVGDSIFIPKGSTSSATKSATYWNVRNKNQGKRLLSRKENDGRRFWLIAITEE